MLGLLGMYLQVLCLVRGCETGEEGGLWEQGGDGGLKGLAVLSVDPFSLLAVLRRAVLGCGEAKRGKCRGWA